MGRKGCDGWRWIKGLMGCEGVCVCVELVVMDGGVDEFGYGRRGCEGV